MANNKKQKRQKKLQKRSKQIAVNNLIRDSIRIDKNKLALAIPNSFERLEYIKSLIIGLGV